MPRILSIDPGHTTGIAIFDSEGKLELSMTVPFETVYKNGFMNNLIRMSRPETVLIEGLPHMAVDATTQSIWSHFSHWLTVAGFNPEIINPGQWKGLAERVEIPGQHARDAATMGRWYIRAKGTI